MMIFDEVTIPLGLCSVSHNQLSNYCREHNLHLQHIISIGIFQFSIKISSFFKTALCDLRGLEKDQLEYVREKVFFQWCYAVMCVKIPKTGDGIVLLHPACCSAL